MNIHNNSNCNSQILETIQVLGPRKKNKSLAWGLLRWRLKRGHVECGALTSDTPGVNYDCATYEDGEFG